jgi:hypothetical protein
MLILPKLFGVKWVYFGSMAIDVIISLVMIFIFIKTFSSLRKHEKAGKEVFVMETE